MKNLMKVFALAAAVLAAGALAAPADAQDVISSASEVQVAADAGIDFANAIPMPLPTRGEIAVQDALISQFEGYPGDAGFTGGARGSGQLAPVRLHERKALDSALLDGFESQEWGTTKHPFTTSRVDTPSYPVSRDYPYRMAGKLFFKDPATGGNFVCSASLIKRGVIVTAAHCIAKYGVRFYSNWVFVPAYNNGSAPFGSYTGAQAWVMTSYRNGTDVCAPGAAGVVCKNDVGVIVLNTYSGSLPGSRVGWYGYGWNGWGFTTETPKEVLVNQLGYPVSHDSGLKMQRTDSEGVVDAALAGNTVWGSRQTGGSSGGPELANLGVAAALTTTVGTYSSYNIVIGVTSWGYTSAAYKEQGASPFLSTNIVPLVNAACAWRPTACQ